MLLDDVHPMARQLIVSEKVFLFIRLKEVAVKTTFVLLLYLIPRGFQNDLSDQQFFCFGIMTNSL